VDFNVKEILRVGRREYHGSIGAAAGAANGDDLLIGAHQAGVRGHNRYLNDHLHALAEDFKRAGKQVSDDVGIELVADGAADAGKKVGAGEDDTTLALHHLAVFFGERLGVLFTEAVAVSHHDDPEAL